MRIMVCYENTPSGLAAMDQAKEYAQKLTARLDVVWVMQRDEPVKHAQLAKLEEELRTEARQLLQDTDIPYETDLLITDTEAGEQIVHFAGRKKADLLFLGIKKKSRVGKALFGSNAQFVITNAPCPVVTVLP